jgi:hypothetical protein
MRERKDEVRCLHAALISYNISVDFEMLSEAIQCGSILPEDF